MMDAFTSPLKEADFQVMREISARCDQRAPFIAALNELGIDTRSLEQQNAAQKAFCDACCRMHSEGRL